MATQQPIKPIGCVAFFIMGFLILGIIKCASCGSDKATDTQTTPTYDPPSNSMAYIQSMDFVKQYLKSPSTADFDKFQADPSVTTPITNEYVVSYHFDAENSFGAKIRSTYTCSLKFLAGDPADINNWELERLIIDGQEIKK